MAQIINTNIYSLNAQRNLNRSQEGLATSLQRLSSGLRVNSARDDAAGLAVAQRMEADARGLTVAMRNASDGISFAQTADGALGTAADMLQRMRELAVQSLNGTISNVERGYLDAEYSQINTELDRLQTAAKLNNQSVFGSFTFQIGAASADSMTAAFASVASVTGGGSAISATANAASALSAIDVALNSVASNRATIGGVMGRMTFTIQQLETARENQYAARSRIMDADFAAETANLTRAQILQQSGTAMVAQANSVPQNVLSLLG